MSAVGNKGLVPAIARGFRRIRVLAGEGIDVTQEDEGRRVHLDEEAEDTDDARPGGSSYTGQWAVSLLTTTSVRVSADTNPGNCIQIGRFMHRITSDTDLTGFTTSACVVADISFYSQGGFLVTLRRLAMGYLTSSWPSLVRSGGNLTVAEDHTPRWLVPLAYVTCAGGIITAITQMQQSPISRPFQHCRFAYDASTRTLYTPYTIATGIGLETDVIPVSTTAEIWLKPGSWMELVTSPAAPSGAGFYLVGYIKTDSDGLLDYLHDYQYRWIDDPGTS